MTLGDLLRLCNQKPGSDLELTVETSTNGIQIGTDPPGGVAISDATVCKRSPRIVLSPSVPLVPVAELLTPIEDVARAELEERKRAHKQLHGGPYIPKSREQDWIDGYVAGVEMILDKAGAQCQRKK